VDGQRAVPTPRIRIIGSDLWFPRQYLDSNALRAAGGEFLNGGALQVVTADVDCRDSITVAEVGSSGDWLRDSLLFIQFDHTNRACLHELLAKLAPPTTRVVVACLSDDESLSQQLPPNVHASIGPNLSMETILLWAAQFSDAPILTYSHGADHPFSFVDAVQRHLAAGKSAPREGVASITEAYDKKSRHLHDCISRIVVGIAEIANSQEQRDGVSAKTSCDLGQCLQIAFETELSLSQRQEIANRNVQPTYHIAVPESVVLALLHGAMARGSPSLLYTGPSQLPDGKHCSVRFLFVSEIFRKHQVGAKRLCSHFGGDIAVSEGFVELRLPIATV
jgi:hypothetical protein